MKSLIRMRSFNSEVDWYDVNTVKGTCSCFSFSKQGFCKHLDQVGIYEHKQFFPKTHPTFSQALSGFVKALRIRNIEDAVYWLVYLLNQDAEGSRFRIARRLVIGSAEDGFSIPVMEAVIKNFPRLLVKDQAPEYFVAEVIRICKVANWWHPSTNGPDYIHAGMVANRAAGLYGAADAGPGLLWQLLVQSVEEQNRTDAMINLEGLVGKKEVPRSSLAMWIHQLSTERGCEEARRLAAIHLTQKGPLSGDCNFLFQAVWWLCGHSSPVVTEIHDVYLSEIKSYLEAAYTRWESPQPIADWYCDGIHCAGKDRRLAGMWPDMMAVCNAFAHYGELSPELKWERDFYSLDGVIYE